jgi:calcium-independent phospholipase A2-gamma
VLTLDGGGARGLVSIEILKQLSKKCGNKPIHELFDFICGTSTGAVLAALIGVYKISLHDCEKNYKMFLKDIFQRNTARGLSNLLMTHSWYDTKNWETRLKDAMGDQLIIQSARDEATPRIAIVSNLTTPNNMKVFLFRNYNYPKDEQSHYDGTTRHCVWQAVRASSAAPGYYEDFKIEGYIFHDGGVLANNPTAIALHEVKNLWPEQPLQCVISIGNGRYQPADYATSKCDSLSVKQKISRIIGGATSTEGVHLILNDLLPPRVYYRFNPYMSEEFGLDEIRSEKWDVMQYDAQMYSRRNDYKFEMAQKQLLKPKSLYQNVNNYVKKALKYK